MRNSRRPTFTSPSPVACHRRYERHHCVPPGETPYIQLGPIESGKTKRRIRLRENNCGSTGQSTSKEHRHGQ